MPKARYLWDKYDKGLEALVAEHQDKPNKPTPRESRFQDRDQHHQEGGGTRK